MGSGPQVASATAAGLPATSNRCSISSSERTGLPSIRPPGGQQPKAKRFADDAQDFPGSPRCGRRRGLDAGGDAAARRGVRRERQGGGRRHLPAAQPVRRRVRAGARRLRREAGRLASWSSRRSTACSPGSIRIRATWTRRASATCRCRPAASSAVSASRSRWRTAWSRSSRRSTRRRPPRPASWPATSSPISTTRRCRA